MKRFLSILLMFAVTVSANPFISVLSGGQTPQQIGVLATDSFTRSDDAAVGNTWVEEGGVVAEILSNRLRFTQGAFDADARVRYPMLTSCENFTIRMRFTVPVISAGNTGPAIGWRVRVEELAFGSQRGYLALLAVDSSSARGKLHIYRWDGAYNLVATSSAISPLPIAGDVCEVTISLTGWTVSATGRNVTQSSTTASLNTTLSSTTQIPGPRDIAVFPVAGTSDVSLVEYTNNDYTLADWLVLGHSITQGGNASVIGNRYFNLLAALRPSQRWINYSGASGLTGSHVSSIAEIKAYLPRKVLMSGIIGNDLVNLTAEATWKANYQSIVSELEGIGAEVWHAIDTPRDASDMTPAKTWLEATYPGKTVDLFTPLLGTGTEMNDALSDEVEGTEGHPNDTGHDLMADTLHPALP
jgi:hypothetical protein